ncbi:hypothetical protein, partial [Bacteroides acidifaciens]|uniref:hypothetical protein n=1 Tax=Bacteroides acidifaciens TaxID=85831 RepID=UPI0026058CB8
VIKAKKGKFTGCIAPFGYMKSPEDKNFLIPDKDTVWIVQKIFGWAVLVIVQISTYNCNVAVISAYGCVI